MLNMTNGEIKPDDEVVFYDGFIYIISREEVETADGMGDMKYSIDVKCLCPEFDEPITLADIAEKYPNVEKVIYDDAMRGYVYNYGNHKDSLHPESEAWELVGDTMGYA